MSINGINPAVTVDQLVETRLLLRDHLKAMAEEHDARCRPYKEKADLLDAALLDRLNQERAESIRTAHGTVYKQEVLSATIDQADEGWDRLLGHIFGRIILRAEQALERNEDPLVAITASPELALFIKGVNKTAVKEILEAKQDLPPGVKVSYLTNLNIRRG